MNILAKRIAGEKPAGTRTLRQGHTSTYKGGQKKKSE